MKDKPSSSLEEDTGEVIEWRFMSQELDQCMKRRKKMTGKKRTRWKCNGLRNTGEIKDKANSLLEDDRRNEDMERFEPRGSGSLLEEVGRESGGRGFGQMLSVGMEACTKKQEVQNMKVWRKVLGESVFSFQRIQPVASAKHA